jgi:hypothetical protein
VSNYAERADDIVKAVRLLRQQGVAVGFPMQTADGDIIFSVGTHTLTADQILELLERGELDAEGVRRSVEAHASATPFAYKLRRFDSLNPLFAELPVASKGRQ